MADLFPRPFLRRRQKLRQPPATHYPAALFDFSGDASSGHSHSLGLRLRQRPGLSRSRPALSESLRHRCQRGEQIASAARQANTEYRVATAEQSGLPDQSVQLVTVAQALHWFNFDRFYAEVNRVLVPGGKIAVWAYGINTVEGDAADALVQDYYHNVVGPYWPPERKFVEEGYRTILSRLRRSLSRHSRCRRTGTWTV